MQANASLPRAKKTFWLHGSPHHRHRPARALLGAVFRVDAAPLLPVLLTDPPVETVPVPMLQILYLGQLGRDAWHFLDLPITATQRAGSWGAPTCHMLLA